MRVSAFRRFGVSAIEGIDITMIQRFDVFLHFGVVTF